MLTPDATPRSTLGGEIASRNPEVRWRVAAVLADLPGAEAEALLLRLMSDPDYRVREKSVSILARRFNPRISDACVEALSGTKDSLRRAAAATVLARAGAAGRPLLLSALSHESPAVRISAARSLPGRHPDAPTVAALEAAMRLEADANVRASLILALGRTGRREALAPLLLELDGPSVWLRVHALEALAEVGDPAVAPRLLPLLDDPSLREVVLRAFARLDSSAPAEELARRAAAGEQDAALVAALRRSAEATSPELRVRLVRLWPGGADVLRSLVQGPEVAARLRADAAHLLACLDVPGAASTLVTAGPFLDGFAALNALPAPRRAEALPDVLKIEDPEAAFVLIEGASDDAARRSLAALLVHPSAAVRAAVLGALPPGTVPVSDLIDLVADDDPETALAAAFALAAETGNASPERSRTAHSALLDRASGPDGPGRAAALLAAASSDDPNVDALVRAGLVSPDVAVRRAATRAAGERPHLSEEDLRTRRGDDDAGVRAAALTSLARWAEAGRSSTIERKDLLVHLADEPAVAAAAGAALVALSGPGRGRLVREMLAQKGPVRRAAVEEIPATRDGAAAEAVARRYPDLVRQAWITAPARAARRLARALAAASGRKT